MNRTVPFCETHHPTSPRWGDESSPTDIWLICCGDVSPENHHQKPPSLHSRLYTSGNPKSNPCVDSSVLDFSLKVWPGQHEGLRLEIRKIASDDFRHMAMETHLYSKILKNPLLCLKRLSKKAAKFETRCGIIEVPVGIHTTCARRFVSNLFS